MAGSELVMREIVPTGYRELARRGLEQYAGLGRASDRRIELPFRRSGEFAAFKDMLQKLERGGKALTDDDELVVLLRTRDRIGQILKEIGAVPTGQPSFIAFCMNVISAAFGESVPRLLTRQGIVPALSTVIGDQQPQLYIWHVGGRKVIGGQFVVNLKQPALYALLNMKHLASICDYGAQTESEKVLSDVLTDPNFSCLVEEIERHKDGKHATLWKNYHLAAFNFHPLVFFTSEEAVTLALQLPVDIDSYVKKLSVAVPKLTFLYCLGTALALQRVFDGLGRSDFFSDITMGGETIKALYKLMFLAHILPNAGEPDSIQSVGTPMTGYLLLHPDHAEQIKSDPALQAEFTKMYFPNLNLPKVVM